MISLATKAGKTASGEFSTEKEDKNSLGHAMGKEFRASLAITDHGFAKGIIKHIEAEQNTIA